MKEKIWLAFVIFFPHSSNMSGALFSQGQVFTVPKHSQSPSQGLGNWQDAKLPLESKTRLRQGQGTSASGHRHYCGGTAVWLPFTKGCVGVPWLFWRNYSEGPHCPTLFSPTSQHKLPLNRRQVTLKKTVHSFTM